MEAQRPMQNRLVRDGVCELCMHSAECFLHYFSEK